MSATSETNDQKEYRRTFQLTSSVRGITIHLRNVENFFSLRLTSFRFFFFFFFFVATTLPRDLFGS